MAKIIVDYRERTSGIVTELAKENEIELKQLISADFIIDGNNKNQEKQLIGIERKTKEDFLNSIIDKRILTQLITLKENFPLQLLIIETDKNSSVENRLEKIYQETSELLKKLIPDLPFAEYLILSAIS